MFFIVLYYILILWSQLSTPSVIAMYVACMIVKIVKSSSVIKAFTIDEVLTKLQNIVVYPDVLWPSIIVNNLIG